MFLSVNASEKYSKIFRNGFSSNVFFYKLETFLGHFPKGEAKPPGFHPPKKYEQ